MKNNQLKRYIWLLDIIYSRGPITKEDIDAAWSESVVNEERQTELPRESFNRFRKAILDVFNIEIKCNRSRHSYYIDNEQDVDNTRQWLFSTFLLTNTVRESKELAQRIDFEAMPIGMRYLPTLMDAMIGQTEVVYIYQNFHRTAPNTVHLQPYGIKLFRRRWYVVGFSHEHKMVRTFALDRAISIRITNTCWLLPMDYNIHEKYADYYGVFTDREPVKIRLRADQKTANYLRTLPIHTSQHEDVREVEYSEFSYYVAPTIEFVQELRTYASGVKVLEPQSLIDEMTAELKKTLAQYDK